MASYVKYHQTSDPFNSNHIDTKSQINTAVIKIE